MPRKYKPRNSYNTEPYQKLFATPKEIAAGLEKHYGLPEGSAFMTVGTLDGYGRAITAAEIKLLRRGIKDTHPISRHLPSNVLGLLKRGEYWRVHKELDARSKEGRLEFKVHDTDGPRFDFDHARLDSELLEHRPGILPISNPNNPTGNWVDVERISGLSVFHPDGTILAVDTTLPAVLPIKGSKTKEFETFDPRPLVRRLLADPTKPVVVLHSVSKTVPRGAKDRVGWMLVTNPELRNFFTSHNLTFGPIDKQKKHSSRLLTAGALVDPLQAKAIFDGHNLFAKGAEKGGYMYIQGDALTPYAFVAIPPEKRPFVQEELDKRNIIIGWHENIGVPAPFARVAADARTKEDVRRIQLTIQAISAGVKRNR